MVPPPTTGRDVHAVAAAVAVAARRASMAAIADPEPGAPLQAEPGLDRANDPQRASRVTHGSALASLSALKSNAQTVPIRIPQHRLHGSLLCQFCVS